MSKESCQDCPLVVICQEKIDSYQCQADRWADVQATADTEFCTGIVAQDDGLPGGVISLAVRRHQRRLETIAQSNTGRSAEYEVYHQRFQSYADSTRMALQAIREQCSGRLKLRAKIARLFGRTACGTKCDSIPTSGSRLSSKEVALGLYDQGFYQGPSL